MGHVSYSEINSLEEVAFIAGNEYTLEFEVFTEDGLPQNLGGAVITWVLSPYGNFDLNVLQKTGSIIDSNVFSVTLSASETQNLSGKYIQQPVIESLTGESFRPGQGIVLILPRIPTV